MGKLGRKCGAILLSLVCVISSSQVIKANENVNYETFHLEQSKTKVMEYFNTTQPEGVKWVNNAEAAAFYLKQQKKAMLLVL